jgi:hypothetical protein
MKINNLSYNFKSLSTIGDGSCFLHSVVAGLCPQYHKLSKKDKMTLAKAIRHDLALTLKDDPIYKSLSRGEIEEISKNIKEMSQQYMQAYLVSGHWINMSFIELISNVLDVNIIIVSHRTKDFYYSGDPEIYFKKNRDSLFIYYYEDAHFESMHVETVEGFKSLFSPQSNIVKDCMKRLFRNKVVIPKSKKK